ncbi:MAG: HAD-IA family hydrolase [Prolixibacteraceae bacterium]|nr:HAD-IA family hydrolase [Prolixibacteraceae bacterium]MBN2774958.1 HAD-IA family hydrolase [Prolixibacteraceae bacterium]
MSLKIHPKAKALIFDLDGTLSDSLPVHIETWNKVGKILGFTFDPQIVFELTGRPTIEFAQRIANDFKLNTDPAEIVRLKQEIFHNSMEYIVPVKEVIAVVLENYGKLPLAVGTGASRRSAELQLKALEILELFDAVVTADDVKNHKPKPETFLKCAEILKVSPVECQVFEDGVLGIKAAEKAGMIVTDVRPFINYGNWASKIRD